MSHISRISISKFCTNVPVLFSPEDQPISGNSASFESSPRSGPSRSASLRVKTGGQPKVTFSDTHTICR